MCMTEFDEEEAKKESGIKTAILMEKEKKLWKLLKTLYL